MFGLAVEILFRFLLETTITLWPAVEVVVLTVAAYPAAIREVEFILLFPQILLGLSLGILPYDHSLVLLSTCLKLVIFFVTQLRYSF